MYTSIRPKDINVPTFSKLSRFNATIISAVRDFNIISTYFASLLQFLYADDTITVTESY